MKDQVITSKEQSVESYLNTSKTYGLSQEEVKIRQAKFGSNKLIKSKRKSFIVLFFGQLRELMSLLLLFAGILALGLTIYQDVVDHKNDVLGYVEASIILAIVFLNALFAAFQEYCSHNAIISLQKLSCPKTKVLREGVMSIIDSYELTIGDIIIVEAGDVIGADCLLLDSSNLKCVEAALTGESVAVLKDHNAVITNPSHLGDRINEIFFGCNVINGKATAIVKAIGNDTEIGKIAYLLSNAKDLKTPLQLKLHKMGQALGIFGIVITIISFIFALLVTQDVINNGFTAAFSPSVILAISLATAAIPEGLNSIVNIVLAIGIMRMSKKNGLIKKLSAVETLGSTAVICSDKTGTLTLNKMSIVKIWNSKNDATQIIDNKVNEEQFELLKYATLCTDCVIEQQHNQKTVIGDPTEIAIAQLALDLGYDDDQWDKDHQRIADIPFDSNRKLMTSINIINNKKIAIVKGAPDILINKCINSNLEKAKKLNQQWSDQAIRVLAVAYKEITDQDLKQLDPNKIEKNLHFMGLIGMTDPARSEVKKSIAECKSAGIKIVMITGDHLNTANAIAKNLGIITSEKDQSITGYDLDQMSDQELKNNIVNYSVFARVSPENKIRIVKAWQSLDQVVAMTGDGVNDAPALQAADIGCAMGITGTDVSKDAADMILIDDNFSTIVESVKQGRSIYENIKGIVKFLLSSNIASIASIFIGTILFYLIFEIGNFGKITTISANYLPYIDEINKQIKFTTTLTTIQILITNLIIETLPGIAIGLQKSTTDLMQFRPRSKYESFFANGLIKEIIINGLIVGGFTIVAYFLGSYIAVSINAPGLRYYYGTIAAFITHASCGIIKAFSMSTNKLFWKESFTNFKYIFCACATSYFILLISCLIPQVNAYFAEYPQLLKIGSLANITDQDLQNITNEIFGQLNSDSMINGYIYLIGFGFSLIPFIILEITKFFEIKKYIKSSKNKIDSFVLIPRPVSFIDKHPFIKKMATKLKISLN